MLEKAPGLTRLFILGVIILSLAARIIPGPRTIDDSYITYRYARNILAGNGFVYNQGERVLGTTTPLYTFLLSTIALFTGKTNAPFPWISLIINALADAVTCMFLFQICKKTGFTIAGIALSLVWAIAPYSVTFAIGGLETSVCVFLLVGSLYFYLMGKNYLCAFFAGLSLLTRPDTLIFIGLLLASRIFFNQELSSKKMNNLFKELFFFIIPILPWFIFSSLYFGSPIPHSMVAKSVTYILPPDAGLTRLLQHYATPFLEHLTFGISFIGIGLILYPFLSLVGVYHFWKSDRRLSLFFLYPFLYFCAFAIANPLIFRWYLTPPLPFYFMLILIGAEKLVNSFSVFLNKNLFNLKSSIVIHYVFVSMIIILPPCIFSIQDWTINPDHGNNRPTPEMAYIQLELLYKQAAQFLTSEIATNPNATLAAGDVGVLGYNTGLRILDTVGLNSLEAMDYYPLDEKYYAINYAIPPDLIMDHQPDYIVILEVYGRLGLLKDSRFIETYDLIEKIPTDMYGSDGMLIFARK